MQSYKVGIIGAECGRSERPVPIGIYSCLGYGISHDLDVGFPIQLPPTEVH